jgi:hypothetical protein
MNPTTTIKVPLSERINVRLIVFVLVVVGLLSMPLYIYISEAVSGGIHQRGDVTEVNLMAMVTWPFDQVNGTINDVPEKWRALDGKRVKLVGEMKVTDSAGDDIKGFDLVYSIAKCCYSGPPQIQHFVHSTGRDGKMLPYYPGLVTVTGTLHVDVVKGPDRVVQVYKLDVDSIVQ